jgi:ABC-type Co2+ transport system permease subunit
MVCAELSSATVCSKETIAMGRAEPWERPHVRRFLLIFVVAGVAAMLGVGLIVLLCRWAGWDVGSTALLSVPWMIGGLLLIPAAFHKGVELERQRQQR